VNVEMFGFVACACSNIMHSGGIVTVQRGRCNRDTEPLKEETNIDGLFCCPSESERFGSRCVMRSMVLVANLLSLFFTNWRYLLL
jgi:hypothetical protein